MDKAGASPSPVKQPKTVAILGASGYIGRHLVEKLWQLGDYRIKLLSRSPDQNMAGAGRNVEVLKGDLREPGSLHGFLEHDCVVVNLAYLRGAGKVANLEMTANLLEACKSAKIGRLIHCSTADVVGRAEEDWIAEGTSCWPITEYSATKLKIEQAIVKAGHDHFDVAILRPTAVFGPESKNLKKLADDLVSGSRLVNYLRSCLFGERRMNLVPVANVVAAIIFMMRREEGFGGEAFIVSDDDCPINNFADVEKFLMREFRIDAYAIPRMPLPLRLLGILLGAMGRNNVNPRCNYNPEKLLNFGFERAMTFEAALAEYVIWYRSTQLARA